MWIHIFHVWIYQVHISDLFLYFSFVSRNISIINTIEDVCYFPKKCLTILLVEESLPWLELYKSNLINILMVSGSNVEIMCPYCGIKIPKIVNIWNKEKRQLLFPKTKTDYCDPLKGKKNFKSLNIFLYFVYNQEKHW